MPDMYDDNREYRGRRRHDNSMDSYNTNTSSSSRGAYNSPTRRSHPTSRGIPDYPPPEYSSQPDPYVSESRPSRRTSRREKPTDSRSPGLNDDYYNSTSSRTPEMSRHRSRRSKNRPFASNSYSDDDDTADYRFNPKSSRPRAKTEARGRPSSRRYSSGYYTDDDRDYDGGRTRDRYYNPSPERRRDASGKPSRSKSILKSLGLSKGDRSPERGHSLSPDRNRGRSPDNRRRRGGKKSYDLTPSPPRHRRRRTETMPSSGGGYGYADTNRDRHGKDSGGGYGYTDKTRDRRGKDSGGGGLKQRSQTLAANTDWLKAGGSAARAAGTAAYELRNDRGPWLGPKGIKVATAALGAVVFDGLLDDKKDGRDRDGSDKRRGGRGSRDKDRDYGDWSDDEGGKKKKESTVDKLKGAAIKTVGEAALKHLF